MIDNMISIEGITKIEYKNNILYIGNADNMIRKDEGQGRNLIFSNKGKEGYRKKNRRFFVCGG